MAQAVQPKNMKNMKNMKNKKHKQCDENVEQMFIEYEKRINKFEDEVCEFPLDSNKIILDKWKPFKSEIYQHMKLCYPLLHGSVLSLAYDFLLIKRKYGTNVEKKLYSKMSLTQFFHRLATKRCVVFYQSYDSYLLRNGYNDSGKWENIGTEKESNIDKYDVTPEKKPKLENYLSYDELLISALCGISSPTHFINNGDRRNCGRINENNFGESKLFPKQGIYLGLVGARYEKTNVMEYSLMIVDREQNTKNNGYGPLIVDNVDNDDNKEQKQQNIDHDQVDFMKYVDKTVNIENTKVIWRSFERFYNISYLPLYEEIREKYNKKDERYYKKHYYGDNYSFLDIKMFQQRIRISLELFLFDANERGLNVEDGSFCHIVGLGTGVWSFKKSVQDSIIVNVTRDIIQSTNLENIKCIYFSWMDQECMMNEEDKCIFTKAESDKLSDKYDGDDLYVINDVSNKHEIFIQFGRRAPADSLKPPFEKCLTVAMYAWDSNSFPGNEYYHGMLSASGDPAAASCSTISYIQNSEINKEYINGENTKIYFYDPKTQKHESYKLKDIENDFKNNNKDKWLQKSRLHLSHIQY